MLDSISDLVDGMPFRYANHRHWWMTLWFPNCRRGLPGTASALLCFGLRAHWNLPGWAIRPLYSYSCFAVLLPLPKFYILGSTIARTLCYKQTAAFLSQEEMNRKKDEPLFPFFDARKERNLAASDWSRLATGGMQTCEAWEICFHEEM